MATVIRAGVHFEAERDGFTEGPPYRMVGVQATGDNVLKGKRNIGATPEQLLLASGEAGAGGLCYVFNHSAVTGEDVHLFNGVGGVPFLTVKAGDPPMTFRLGASVDLYANSAAGSPLLEYEIRDP